jgi:hypothetical protein
VGSRTDDVPSLVGSTGETEVDNAAADEGPMPKIFRVQMVESFVFLVFIFGIFTLACIPLMFMTECDAPACLEERYVSKTSII